jgi:flagellar biosynthetic protein FliR
MNFSSLMIQQFTVALMLTSLRILGLFLTAPMLSFRAFPMQFRVMLSVFIAFMVMPVINSGASFDLPTTVMMNFYSAAIELCIGAFIGFTIRVGLMVVEIAAEVLSFLSGFSYASTLYRDPSLDSGLVSVFLNLVALAYTFTLNLHLVFIDIVIQSIKTLPFGSWPTEWNMSNMMILVSESFQLGLIVSIPIFLAYLMFNLIQGFLGRTSPQLNLFSVGFAFTIPLAFLVLNLIIPEVQSIVIHALENPLSLVRNGVEMHLGR